MCIRDSFCADTDMYVIQQGVNVFISLQVEKVQFISNIKDIPVKEARNAEMALLCGNYTDAEAILLQAGLVFRAVMLNIQLYNWDRWVVHWRRWA